MILDFKKEQWLDTAVSGIKFHLDRQKVRQELEGHVEDKMADLHRIFPDIPDTEAQARALASMGDPEEVKQELAKIHKPWLGRLWMASRMVLAALWMVALMSGLISADGSMYRSIWGRGGADFYGAVQTGETARAGGYTFRITGAACLDWPEGTGDTLQIVLRASTPRFWEKIDIDALLNSLYLTGPDGERRYMGWVLTQDVTVTDELGNTHTSRHWTSGGGLCRWSLWWTELALNVPAEGWTPGGQVTVELDSEVGSFTLSVPVQERVEVPVW